MTEGQTSQETIIEMKRKFLMIMIGFVQNVKMTISHGEKDVINVQPQKRVVVDLKETKNGMKETGPKGQEGVEVKTDLKGQEGVEMKTDLKGQEGVEVKTDLKGQEGVEVKTDLKGQEEMMENLIITIDVITKNQKHRNQGIEAPKDFAINQELISKIVS